MRLNVVDNPYLPFSERFRINTAMFLRTALNRSHRSPPFLLGELAAEHEDVGLGLVDHVVHPPDGLLHAELAPLILVHQHVAGDVAAVLLREDDVAVLVLVVEILLRVEDLRLHLGEEHAGLLAL